MIEVPINAKCIHSDLSTHTSRSRDLPVGSWEVASSGSDRGSPFIWSVCFSVFPPSYQLAIRFSGNRSQC